MKGFIRFTALATSLLVATFAIRFAEASDAVVPQAPHATQAEVYSSGGDRLIIPSLQTGDAGRCGGSALNAPVNVYDVGSNLQMGEPIADCDVVRQNFAAFPGVGGYPGDGGTTTLAGHVDYHPNYDWGSLVTSGGTESIVLITCDGVFNAATHEYSNRFVVHGVIVQ